jgi:uncharacterized protein (TIGR03437 family)
LAGVFLVQGGDQINAQVPWAVQPGVADIGVNGTMSSISIAPAAPGIFTVPGGHGFAIAINNTDETLAWPIGLAPQSHPAKAGDILTVYATGLGAVDPAIRDGQAAPDSPLSYTVIIPTILVGGVAIPPDHLLFSGLAPQFVGVNQINILLPNDVAHGAVPLQIQAAGITSTNLAVIAIQ